MLHDTAIVVATRNHGKRAELAALAAAAELPFPVEWLTLDDVAFGDEVVEDRDTFEGNARKKAEEVAAATGLLTLADDSGLEVDAIGGAPGVRSARYAGVEPRSDEANNVKLLAALTGLPRPRTARFRSVLALARPGAVLCVVDGRCEGEILDERRGTNGFGYDPLFYVPSLGKTLAECTMEEKNRVSHRAEAMRALLARLPSLLGRT